MPRALSIVLLLTLGAFGGGCVVHTTGHSTVVRGHYVAPSYVYVSAPPPPLVAAVTPGLKPSPDAIWVEGYWDWQATGWVWVGGHWETGRPGWVWEQPVCVYVEDGGYQYHPGHWRPQHASPPPIYRAEGTIQVHVGPSLVPRVPPSRIESTTVVVAPGPARGPSGSVTVRPRPATVVVQPQRPATVVVQPQRPAATVTVQPQRPATTVTVQPQPQPQPQRPTVVVQPQRPATTVTVQPQPQPQPQRPTVVVQPQRPTTTVTVQPQRPNPVQPQPVRPPSVQAQPTTVQPNTNVRPSVQAQPTTVQPNTNVRPSVQAQPTTVQPNTNVRPSVQAQPTTVQPNTNLRPAVQARPATVSGAVRPGTVQPGQVSGVARPGVNLQANVQCAPVIRRVPRGGFLVLRGAGLAGVTAVQVGAQSVAVATRTDTEVRARLVGVSVGGPVRITVGGQTVACGNIELAGN